MAVTVEYLQFVLEQLQGLKDVTPRRMFGGVGLYHDQRFFAIVMGDTLYLKVNDANRGDYETRGMGRFRPYANKPQLSVSYYALPADILEDAEECSAWARRSIAIAAMRSMRSMLSMRSMPSKPLKPSKPSGRRSKRRAR